MKSPSRAAAALACAVLALTLTACGGGSENDGATREVKGDLTATPAAEVAATPPADAKVLAISLDGKTVEPTALKLPLKPEQPLVLRITATEAGQLHVHSTPEHTVDFPAGDSEITLTIDDPGVVDIEEHRFGILIAQLEVS